MSNALPARKMPSILALEKMEEALDLLDEDGAAGDVGAHLDLAICRLRERLERNGSQGIKPA